MSHVSVRGYRATPRPRPGELSEAHRRPAGHIAHIIIQSTEHGGGAMAAWDTVMELPEDL